MVPTQTPTCPHADQHRIQMTYEDAALHDRYMIPMDVTDMMRLIDDQEGGARSGE